MYISPPSPEAQIRFLQNVQRLLTDGSFVASYKFALLHAIADLCVYKGDDHGGELLLQTRDIAARFIELYWPQSAPFPAPGSQELLVLRQNTGRQAAILKALVATREHFSSLARLKAAGQEWSALVTQVNRIVKGMPLWKLQTIGSEPIEFLYENVGSGSEIALKPGVAYCFRAFHDLLTDLVRGAWLRYVRRYNQEALGDHVDLAGFLFGSDRMALGKCVPILMEPQQGRCFYCERPLNKDSIQVDHFIPWVRHPVDLGHNFVLAHASCNNAKSDHLAAEEHLERWVGLHESHGGALGECFRDAEVACDLDISHRIAAWAYGQVEAIDGQVWLRGGGNKRQFTVLTGSWAALLARTDESVAVT